MCSTMREAACSVQCMCALEYASEVSELSSSDVSGCVVSHVVRECVVCGVWCVVCDMRWCVLMCVRRVRVVHFVSAPRIILHTAPWMIPHTLTHCTTHTSRIHSYVMYTLVHSYTRTFIHLDTAHSDTLHHAYITDTLIRHLYTHTSLIHSYVTYTLIHLFNHTFTHLDSAHFNTRHHARYCTPSSAHLSHLWHIFRRTHTLHTTHDLAHGITHDTTHSRHAIPHHA